MKNIRTNPDTCRHDIIQPIETEEIIICGSCESTLDQAWLDERKWDYDIDYHVWVRNYKKE
jgi:hypothetical protein